MLHRLSIRQRILTTFLAVVLTGDILQLIIAGRQIQLATKVSDPAAALQDIARHWRMESERSGLVFKTDIPPGLPELPVNADDLRLMVDNLLSNAIKYTTAGEIRLNASVQDNWLILQPAAGLHRNKKHTFLIVFTGLMTCERKLPETAWDSPS